MQDIKRLSLVSKAVFVSSAALFIGVIIGAVGQIRTGLWHTGEIQSYFQNFFGAVPRADKQMLYAALDKYFIVWMLIFASGFFMPGALVNIFAVLKRGYVIGYTSACFYNVYGIKGVLPCLALIPEMFIFVPVLTFFSSISLKMSFFSHETKKLFFKKYLFWSLIFMSVFCMVSLFQTFLTTIFMRIISRLM